MSKGLLERLSGVLIDRDWLVAQIDAIEGLTFHERIVAGKCLGRFDHTAQSTEEVAFLGNGDIDRTREIVTMALDHCDQHASDDELRSELTRVRVWLFDPNVE
jgi:hypothetical protein